MNKLYWLLLSILLIPSATFAFSEQTWERVSINVPIQDDLYTAWDSINVHEDITWDMIAWWWEIKIDWIISGDFIWAWWAIEFRWEVWDDVRVAWWQITIEKNIWWDLIVWAWDVEIKNWAIIKWDLIVWAWRLIMNWEVKWNTFIRAWELVLWWKLNWDSDIAFDEDITIMENAWVFWDLIYKSPEISSKLEEVSYWAVEYKKAWGFKWKEYSDYKKDLLAFAWKIIIVKVLFLSIFGSLFLIYFSKFSRETALILKKQTWKSFWIWFLLFLIIPIITCISFAIIIWYPIWILWIMMMILLIMFYELISVIVFSAFTIEKMQWIKKFWNTKKILITIWYSLVFALISWIDIIAWFFAIWAWTIMKMEIIKKLR